MCQVCEASWCSAGQLTWPAGKGHGHCDLFHNLWPPWPSCWAAATAAASRNRENIRLSQSFTKDLAGLFNIHQTSVWKRGRNSAKCTSNSSNNQWVQFITAKMKWNIQKNLFICIFFIISFKVICVVQNCRSKAKN